MSTQTVTDTVTDNDTVTIILNTNNVESNNIISSQHNEIDTSGYEIVYLSNCEFIPDDMTILHICTCGDLFIFKIDDLRNGKTTTECPSCSLKAMLQFTPNELEDFIKK